MSTSETGITFCEDLVFGLPRSLFRTNDWNSVSVIETSISSISFSENPATIEPWSHRVSNFFGDTFSRYMGADSLGLPPANLAITSYKRNYRRVNSKFLSARKPLLKIALQIATALLTEEAKVFVTSFAERCTNNNHRRDTLEADLLILDLKLGRSPSFIPSRPCIPARAFRLKV
ncbi:MAG: hypothetical protein NTY03_09680 [Candidatus Bathyarchaeota archaeon]|nr:hypothetical protein [Candidatus Bathyarchaeota archaeon]